MGLISWWLRMLGLAVLGGAVFGVMATPKPDQVPDQVPTSASQSTQPTEQNQYLSTLNPERFLQLLVARNIEVQYSKISSDVTRYLKDGEASLYEPTAFMGIREEGRSRQRTPDERLQNFSTSGTAILDENGHSDELGLRGKLPTGAEVAVSYKSSRKSNNLIPQSTNGFDTEYNAVLNLTLKQPLRRNAGRSVTETDRNVAELEYKISLHQLTQQTLKSSMDGLNLYWQLHRAQETAKLRKEAIDMTKALLADANARVAAGKLPANAVLELQGAMLNRQVELARSQQALREAQSKLCTAINLFWNESTPVVTKPEPSTLDSSINHGTSEMAQALSLWSPYQIALLKQLQTQVRLNFAKNQTKSLVDFVMSYSGTGYSNHVKEARTLADQGAFPDWYMGLNFEFPIKGNQKAQQQFLAQSARQTQAELELLAIQNSFANDFVVRIDDLKMAHDVLESSHEDVKLRESIFNNERQRINLGSGSLRTLIQRQVDLTESRQRLLENLVHFEVAMATWQYTRGTLLTDHHIKVSDESTSTQ